ncbi:sugar-phosphatase [Enterococcus sp. 2201sp1_2201st1_B8_2201SCRN_220225]|uniref:sugar-phosphatase n=1 Tax=unclassified Enterococcus TaxID=2608891 RepID=UPI0034A5C8E2
MSIRLIAIDIDGTLVNSERQLTERVKNTLIAARNKGVKIVLCTGRPLPGVQPELEALGLLSDQDYVITYNGSLVQNVGTKAEIFSAHLTKDDYVDIQYMAQKLGVHLHVSSNDAIYTANRDISPYTVHESWLVHMPIKYRTADEMISNPVEMIKLMMIDEPEILDAAIAQLPADFRERYTVVKSAPFYLEVLHPGASKGVALAQLASHLELTADEVMAIGDNENDLTMIDYAGIGVAMANAIDLVKEAADVETASNDEDGVALVVEQYVL